MGNGRVLVYSNYGAGGATAGSGTTWDLILQASGLRNAAAEAGIGLGLVIALNRNKPGAGVGDLTDLRC